MEKQLDKELYPEYVYTRITHFLRVKRKTAGRPVRAFKVGEMITDRIPQKLGSKRSPRRS